MITINWIFPVDGGIDDIGDFLNGALRQAANFEWISYDM
jgi:hypothetical protein